AGAAGRGVLSVLVARRPRCAYGHFSWICRKARIARDDAARVLAGAGLDFACRIRRVVPGSVVAQPGISLEWPLARYGGVSSCLVLGDPLDVGRRLGSRYSRAARVVRRDSRHGARRAAREAARRDSASP